jgi:DNA polymerase-3 subunit alpha
LNTVFHANKGENQVTFEVMELETIRKEIPVLEAKTTEIKLVEPLEPALFEDGITDEEVIYTEEISEDEEPILVEPYAESTVLVEETKVVTRISMPSRKLKIKISNELLTELEKMQINFKLN